MGVLVATGLHYRTNGVCKAAVVLVDNPPIYDTCDLTVTTVGALTAIVQTHHAAVGRDPATPPTTDGTWHYPQECPDDVRSIR